MPSHRGRFRSDASRQAFPRIHGWVRVDELTLTAGMNLPLIHVCWEPDREEMKGGAGRSGTGVRCVITKGMCPGDGFDSPGKCSDGRHACPGALLGWHARAYQALVPWPSSIYLNSTLAATRPALISRVRPVHGMRMRPQPGNARVLSRRSVWPGMLAKMRCTSIHWHESTAGFT